VVTLEKQSEGTRPRGPSSWNGNEEKKDRDNKLINLLEDQGNGFKEIVGYVSASKSKKENNSSVDLDVPSMHVTIRMLKDAGQEREANEMLKELAKYQMNNIRKAMPSKSCHYYESDSVDSDN
jgi:hypothetical protein